MNRKTFTLTTLLALSGAASAQTVLKIGRAHV